MHQVNTTLSLMMNAGVMVTNLKAELPSYGAVWFDPQAMTNMVSFGNHSQTVSHVIPTRIRYISSSVKQPYQYFWL